MTLRNQQLQYLGQRFMDTDIVNGGRVKCDRRIRQPGIVQVIDDTLLDISDCIFAVVITDGVGFVNEHGEFYG